MRKLMMIGCAVAVATSATLPVHGEIICSGESDEAVRVNAPVTSAMTNSMVIHASPWGGVGGNFTNVPRWCL